MAQTEGRSENKKKDSPKSSTRRLVRILVIVGIGIPVLVELLTLFNLINVQLIGGKEEPATQMQPVEEVRTYAEGDTLFSEAPNPLVIRALKIKVSAQQWRLELNISPSDTTSRNENLVSVDSLRLNSGTILKPEQSISLNPVGEESAAFVSEWELPDGDMPQIIYVHSVQPVTSDSMAVLQQEFKLGKPAIRYEQ